MIKALPRIAASIVAFGIVLGTSTIANADTPSVKSDLDLAAAGANEVGYLIVAESEGIEGKNGQVFFPTGPIDDDTLIVIAEPDGSLPAGITIDSIERVVAANREGERTGGGESGTLSNRVMTALPRAYTATSTSMSSAFSGGSVIGANWSATANYIFNAAIGTSQRNAAQGLGYYRGYSGTTFGVWQAWYGLGTATASTEGGAFVPWGYVAAVQKLRAQCATTTVCSGNWGPL